MNQSERGNVSTKRTNRLLPGSLPLVWASVLLFVAVAMSGPLVSGDHGGYSCQYEEQYAQPAYFPPGSRDGETWPIYLIVHGGLLDERYPSESWPRVYVESNGIAGLQRHDYWCIDEDENGDPYTHETADTLLY